MFEHLPKVSEADFGTEAEIGFWREVAENLDGYLRELKECNPWLGQAVEVSARTIADVRAEGYVAEVEVDALMGLLAVLRLVDRRLEEDELEKL